MSNSYEDIMFIVQALGREPVSLLGKNYAFIYDHVRRNYLQGTYVDSKEYDNCYKFTFYKEVPTVRFADPYNDPMNWLGKWTHDFKTETTETSGLGGGTSIHYSESDNQTENKKIGYQSGLEFGNPGTYTDSIISYGPQVQTCDLIGKTNSNFNHGKYQTLISRFHTNAMESRDKENPTQTAFSNEFGQSHGRNLLKASSPDNILGYDNPYCRVWTYFHQYNQVKRQIRPFGTADDQESLELSERVGDYNTVGFRTQPDRNYKIEGGSKRLDKYGVLNYQNGTVNIAPTAKIVNYFDGKNNEYEKGIIETKKCMFSIENLAWKDIKSSRNEYDERGLSPEQKGPLGGRIMWFPPYDLKFNEDVSVNWNSNKFIGRGEDVYTYTNTERRGNLSFVLLIDHPSILDYWTRQSSDGKPLAKGNSGGIDNKENEENTLLRFFAGCEVLSAKPQKYLKNVITPKIEKKPIEIKKDTPIEPDETIITKHKKIVSVLYFPNNYTGVDDGIGDNQDINPIWYLMSGVGTQQYIDDENNLRNLPTLIDVESASTMGYEIEEEGISLISENDVLAEDYCIISSTSVSDGVEFLTEGDGTKIYGNYNGKDYPLAKLVSNKALSVKSAKGKNGDCSVSRYVSGKSHLWYRKRYYYRCDKEYLVQNFSDPKSYIDFKSYQLNHSGFSKIREEENTNIASAFGIENDSDDYTLVSFTDIFAALEKNNKVVIANNSENVDLIKNIFSDENKETYTNIKISFCGHASSQGRVKTNKKIARNRGETLKKWLIGFNELKNDVEFGNVTVIKQEDKKNMVNVGGQDKLVSKLWRSASLVIEYDMKTVENASDAEKTILDENGNNIVDKVESKSKETSKNSKWFDLSEKTKKIATDAIKEAKKSDRFGADFEEEDDYLGEDWIQDTLNELNSTEEGIVTRYDNEGEFFETLSKDAPFLHHLISEKIKYFDPAFHSISPEGFNARLTFLHQCTRQGSTVEQSAFDSTTAYNLAFGRPPVCVLRLGDFFNTKIVITSLNIQYEQPQWDMNPEGIGMMPMFANVTINFNFLGGSDLSGPIARLQNAVSFNYYANTSVYDNRADVVEYDKDGSGKEIKYKGFVYPQIYTNKNKNISLG